MKGVLILIILLFVACNNASEQSGSNKIETKDTLKMPTTKDSIIKLEMHLSAYGVESDDFPFIDADIDFTTDSAWCRKSYYNPKYKDSIYTLDKHEIRNVLRILQNANLEKLKKEYKVLRTDQPTSTIIIFTQKQKFEIKDYGLEGDYPLQELYKIVYKL
jgi:hypothetical protein